MPKTRQEKEEIVKKTADKLKDMKSLVIADYYGLNVSEVEELRKKCREQGVEYMAVKKSLLRLAAKEAGLDVKMEEYEGSLAAAIGMEDELAPAKILNDFAKEHENLKMLAGILDSQYLSAEQVRDLAKIPSRPELLAKAVGSMKAPLSGFVNVLQGNIRGLIYALSAIKEKGA